MSCLKLFAPVELSLFSPEDAPGLRIYPAEDDLPDLEEERPVLLSFTSAHRLRHPAPASLTNEGGNVVFVPVRGGPPPVLGVSTAQNIAPRLRLFVADQ